MKVRTRVVWVAAAAVWGCAGVAGAAEAWEAPGPSVTSLPVVLPPAPRANVAQAGTVSTAAGAALAPVASPTQPPTQPPPTQSASSVAVTAVVVPAAAPMVSPAVVASSPAPTGMAPTVAPAVSGPAAANPPSPAAAGDATTPRAIIIVPSLAEIPDDGGPVPVDAEISATGAAVPSSSSSPASPVAPSSPSGVPATPAAGHGESWADPFAPAPVPAVPAATPLAPATMTSVETFPAPAPRPSEIRYVGRRYTGLPEDYRLGMGLLVGGGVVDFARSTIQEMTATGGTWDARLVFGARDVLGLETAYVGTARNIRTLGLGSDAMLVSNGAEGVLRLNIPVIDGASIIEPFAFAGLGWSRYEISRNALNTSSVAAADDVLEIPYGAGLTIGYAGFLADVRFTYRATYYNDMLRSASASTESKRLDSWSLGAHIGFEF